MACSVEAYRSAIGLFVAVLMKILSRYARKAATKIHGFRVNGFCALLAVSCLLSILLIGCVEPQPGPLTHVNDSDNMTEENRAFSQCQRNEGTASGVGNSASSTTTTTMDTRDLLQYLTSSVQAMTHAITRLEEGQRQLREAVNQQLTTMQTSLGLKMQQLGEEQHIQRLDINELNSKQGQLEDENAKLRENVQHLASKVEELDSERRKSNLLFFGIPKRIGKSCEELIKEVLQSELKITEDVGIVQAFRVGQAILVKFQSMKQRAKVLAQTKLLTSQNPLSVREDLPEVVRRRRRGVIEFYKQLRKDNKKAILRSDKLITDDGVYTYDLQQQQIVRLETSSQPRTRQQVASGTRGGHDSTVSMEFTSSGDQSGTSGDDATVVSPSQPSSGSHDAVNTLTSARKTTQYTHSKASGSQDLAPKNVQ